MRAQVLLGVLPLRPLPRQTPRLIWVMLSTRTETTTNEHHFGVRCQTNACRFQKAKYVSFVWTHQETDVRFKCIIILYMRRDTMMYDGIHITHVRACAESKASSPQGSSRWDTCPSGGNGHRWVPDKTEVPWKQSAQQKHSVIEEVTHSTACEWGCKLNVTSFQDTKGQWRANPEFAVWNKITPDNPVKPFE